MTRDGETFMGLCKKNLQLLFPLKAISFAVIDFQCDDDRMI